MLKRSISGLIYVAIIVGFFFLRQRVDTRLFYVFLWFLSFMSTIEVARAEQKNTDSTCMIFAIFAGLLFVPAFVVGQELIENGCLLAIDIVLFICVFNVIICLALKIEKKKIIHGLVAFFYPNAFILFMLLLNNLQGIDGQRGYICMLMMFVISPASDVFAYLFGTTYKKIKKDDVMLLCPNISPNKTVVGAVGGLIGSVIGALIVCYFAKPEILYFSPYAFCTILGLLGGLMTECGDLFESWIKRRCGIKDMGKIMPGHGGITDRIDGMCFCAVIEYCLFILV